MDNNLVIAKSAQSVQADLASKGLDCKVLALTESTKTAEMAANALGCDVAQIIKSLIFKTKLTHLPVLVLASGANRVSEKLIASYIGEPIIKADADFTRETTGFSIGGIPPIGHKNLIDHIFIDEYLLQFTSLWAAAGTPNSVFNLQSVDLLDLTHGKVVAIK